MKQDFLKPIKQFADSFDIDWRILYAIGMNESNGSGREGELIKHRFEKYIFNQFARVKEGAKDTCPSLPYLDKVWIRKHSWAQLQLMATSWGMFQIMGWHYPSLGFSSIDQMVDCYKGSEDYQVRSFLYFCVKYRDSKFLKALKKGWLRTIARYYNGAGYAKNNYVQKLIKHIRSAPV